MKFLFACLAMLIAIPGFGQGFDDAVLTTPLPRGEGFAGFGDWDFMLKTIFNLSLAAALGALIGFHPRSMRTADTLQEVEAPKVDIMYATIGALVGIMVVKYGLVIDQHQHRSLSFFLKHLGVGTAGTRGDAPVHIANIVARLIISGFNEIHTTTTEARPIIARQRRSSGPMHG